MGSSDLEFSLYYQKFLRKKTGQETICCYRCGKALEIGQAVHTVHGVNLKVYHATCWEGLFLEI